MEDNLGEEIPKTTETTKELEKSPSSSIKNEEISREKTEELIQEILQEETSKQETEQKPSKINLNELPYLIGAILSFLLLLLGIFIIIFKPFHQMSKKEEAPHREALQQNENRTIVKDTELQTKEETKTAQVYSFSRDPTQEKKYPYKLELKNFLFPLEENIFLKLEITLYFDKPEPYKKAFQGQSHLRENFVIEISKKRDPNFWRNLEKIKEFETYMIEILKKGSPSFEIDKIEIEGVMLKV